MPNGDLTVESKNRRTITLSWALVIWLITIVFGAGASLSSFATKAETQEKVEKLRIEVTQAQNELRKEMNAKFDKIISILLDKGKK